MVIIIKHSYPGKKCAVIAFIIKGGVCEDSSIMDTAWPTNTYILESTITNTSFKYVHG